MRDIANLSTKGLKVSEPYPCVIHIEFSRDPVNAFTTEYWREYGKLLGKLTDAHGSGIDIRAVVLSSANQSIFTAGLDLSSASNLGSTVSDNSQDPARRSLSLRRFILEFQGAISAPEKCPFPVIVALHGPVIGLGIDIISACDIRYASSNASFAIKEVDIGLAPDIGTIARLPKITGNSSLVHELAYTGRSFSAAEAEKLGLVSTVVEGGRDAVIAAALKLGKLIASKSPVAVAGSKHLILHSRDHSVADNLDYTAAWNASAIVTKDITESLRAMKLKQASKFAALGIPSKL